MHRAKSKARKDTRSVKVNKLRRQCAYWNSGVVDALGQCLIPHDQSRHTALSGDSFLAARLSLGITILKTLRVLELKNDLFQPMR